MGNIFAIYIYSTKDLYPEYGYFLSTYNLIRNILTTPPPKKKWGKRTKQTLHKKRIPIWSINIFKDSSYSLGKFNLKPKCNTSLNTLGWPK